MSDGHTQSSLPAFLKFMGCPGCPQDGSKWTLIRVRTVHEIGGEYIPIMEPFYLCNSCYTTSSTTKCQVETLLMVQSKYDVRKKINSILADLLLLVYSRNKTKPTRTC